MEHLKWSLSKKSFDHLIPPFAFGILKNLLKDTTGFQIYHYGLILELVLHAKLYQRLSICPKTSSYLEIIIERLIYFVGDRKELIYARVTWSKGATWPDWLNDKSFSFKNLYSLLNLSNMLKVFQRYYCRSEAKIQVGNFWCTVYLFFFGSESHWLFSIP